MIHIRAWVNDKKVEIHNSHDPNLDMSSDYQLIQVYVDEIPSLIRVLQDAYSFINEDTKDYKVFSTK